MSTRTVLEELGHTPHEGLEQFQLDMLELVGRLVLMLHWYRGILDICVQTRAIPLEGEWLTNWNRAIADLNTFEKYVWEVAPPRAMLPVLRHLRQTGKALEDHEVLLQKDEHGRTPYAAENLDDIEDLLRRVMDCQIYERNNVRSTQDTP